MKSNEVKAANAPLKLDESDAMTRAVGTEFLVKSLKFVRNRCQKRPHRQISRTL